jgi:peroxiredoxin
MKIPHLFLSILLCVACPQSQAEPAKSPDKPISKLHANDIQDLKIGDAAPDFKLLGIDDKRHTLGDYRAAKVLMVAFISNHCPDSHAAEARIKKLIRDMPAGQFSLVAINPNSPDGLSIDELGFSKYNDGFDDMKKYAADEGFNFPYLYDGETQAIAKAYGCLATPHVFVFDADRKLRYKGQFDDSRFADEATVTSQDARHAVEALLAGKPVPVEITKPHGCSTKWLDKKDLVSKKVEQWDKTPVDMEVIDAAGVAGLRKNGTNKMRLFNVWATTCAPCVAEFPELVTTARKFGLRDFELITISTDDPKDSAKVKAFLEKRGAGLLDRLKPSLKAEGRTTNSYIFKEADTNALMKALDPEWPGAIPHTVLVGTNGEILWRHNGAVNGEELRTVILEKMGRFYRP